MRKSKPPKVMRRFTTELTVKVEVSQSLLDTVLTDEWRAAFYDLSTPEEVAEHIAYYLARGVPLTVLSGFANQAGQARLLHVDPFYTRENGAPAKPAKKRGRR